MQKSRGILTSALALGAVSILTLSACAPNTRSDSTDTHVPEASGSGSSTTLTILGAASTRVLNDELSEQVDDQLEFVNTGSSTLVQQLKDGAPADIFISADQKNMDKAVADGTVKDPVVVATNSMVMVVPKGNPGNITGVDESLENSILALCDVQVPCGNVSRMIQDDLGIELKPATLEQSVSNVLGKVTSGEADAGWVYLTDAQAAGDDVEVIDIPGADKHSNEIVAAVTVNSEHPDDAAELLDVLSSDVFAKIWSAHGFTPAAAKD